MPVCALQTKISTSSPASGLQVVGDIRHILPVAMCMHGRLQPAQEHDDLLDLPVGGCGAGLLNPLVRTEGTASAFQVCVRPTVQPHSAATVIPIPPPFPPGRERVGLCPQRPWGNSNPHDRRGSLDYKPPGQGTAALQSSPVRCSPAGRLRSACGFRADPGPICPSILAYVRT